MTKKNSNHGVERDVRNPRCARLDMKIFFSCIRGTNVLKVEGLGNCVRGHQKIHKKCYNARVKNILYFIYFKNQGLLRNMVGKTLGDIRNHAKNCFWDN